VVSPSPSSKRADPDGTSSGVDVTVAMHALVEAVRPEFPAAISWIVEQLRSAVPEFADPALEPSRLRRMCEEQFLTVGTLLAAAAPPDVVVPAAVTRTFSRDVFRWRIPLDALLRLLSVGLRSAWAWWREVFETRVPDAKLRTELISRSTDLLFAYHHRMVSVSVEEYGLIAEASARGMTDRRIRIVRQILESTGLGDEEAQSHRLGYKLAVHHVGFVLWADVADDDIDDDTTAHLLRTSRRWLAEVGCVHPLLLPGDGRTMWAWQSSARSPRLDELPVPEAPLRVAVGQPARGIHGFRVTHHEAQAARRVAQQFGLDKGVVHHADVETLSLITNDDEAINRYLTHKLGSLTATDTRTAELREALRVFLAAGGRINDAASQLGIHRNTLARRVETAVERSTPGRDWLGLALALEISSADPTQLSRHEASSPDKRLATPWIAE